MLNNLKVEYCTIEKDYKKNITYTPVDITAYVNQPELVVSKLDNSLDSATIELDNTSKIPFKPQTRFILRVEETEEITVEPTFDDSWTTYEITKGTTYYKFAYKNIKSKKWIWSYTKDTGTSELSDLTKQENRYLIVSSDTVNQLTYETTPTFRHTIELVEATKLLEREISDNTTSTHTLAQQSDILQEIVNYTADIYSGETGIGFAYYDYANNGYIGDPRFRQPFRDGDTINLDVRLDVQGIYKMPLSFTPNKLHYLDLTLNTYEIQKPNGVIVDVSEDATFTFDQNGIFRIYQQYTGTETSALGSISFEYQVYWYLTVYEAEDIFVQKRTIMNVIDRILSIAPLRRDGLDSVKYQFNELQREKLSTTLAPELSFTGTNLMENMSIISSTIQAIPRLLSSLIFIETDTSIYYNDWQSWNTISFDFLGETDLFSNTTDLAIQDASQSIDDYATNLVSYVENAVQTNARKFTSAVEPFDGGFISPRTESADFIVDDTTVTFKTSQPIYRILNAYIVTDTNLTFDITSHIVEQNKYILMSSYDGTSDSKSNTLYYQKGSNIISGLTFIHDTALGSLFAEEAIRNIIGSSAPTNLVDLAVRITYIPYRNFKARQYKQIIEDNTEHSSLIYNQSGQVIDIEHLGENVKGALLRSGNPLKADTYYFDSFVNIPSIGQITSDFYYIYSISTQIYNNMYKCTIELSKDYNKLNEFLGINSDYRQYEISELETSNRALDYGEFCLVSTALDYGDDLIGDTDYISYLSSIGFTNKAITEIKNRFDTITGSLPYAQQMSWSYIKTTANVVIDGVETTQEFKILMPVSAFSYGNSILFGFKFQDNYSAGTHLTEATSARSVEDYVEYSNDYGNFETMAVAFGVKNPSTAIPYVTNETAFSTATRDTIRNYSKDLYTFTDTLLEDNVLIDFRTYPFDIRKDSREAISLAYQLNFVTNTRDIYIGKALSEIYSFMGDSTTTLKIVMFDTMPNLLSNETIDSDTYTEVATTQYSLPLISQGLNLTAEYSEGDGNLAVSLYTDYELNQTTGVLSASGLITSYDQLTIGNTYYIVDGNYLYAHTILQKNGGLYLETIINEKTYLVTENTTYSPITITQDNTYKYIKIENPELTGYVGWGILTNDNKLVIATKNLNDIYLMFRNKI